MLREKLKILFLCTGNSCRSQMAEGWAHHLKSEMIEAYSAGTDPQGLNPLAVRVMAEVGIDISNHQSKSADNLPGIDFDFVITVCDRAHESCPVFPGKTKVVHMGFEDPPRLALDADAQSDEEALPHYRLVRDAIGEFINLLPETLNNTNHCEPSSTSNNREKETRS